MKRERYQGCSVELDKRVNIWYLRWWKPDGKHGSKRIGTLSEYPTKARALKAAAPLRAQVQASPKQPTPIEGTFEYAARRYMAEKMPTRETTAGAYRNYIERYCIPRWGTFALNEIAPMVVWQWINNLTHRQTGQPLAGKTKSHVRAAMRQVYEFAMLAGLYPIERNPIDLVTVKGGTKPSKKRRVLSYAEWEHFISFVTAEPHRTAIITCMCLSIRREELWGLMWGDFDFDKGI